MNDEYAVPYSCAKSELGAVFAGAGKRNVVAVQVDHEVWAPGSLVCLGFRGALNIDSCLYEGVLCFRAATGDDVELPYMAAGTGIPGAALREEI